MLDTGGRDLPGSVFSVSSVLLTFLSALAEPVVPVSLHARCMDCCNNATLCKQVGVVSSWVWLAAGCTLGVLSVECAALPQIKHTFD